MEVQYFIGHVISTDEIKSHPDKVPAINIKPRAAHSVRDVELGGKYLYSVSFNNEVSNGPDEVSSQGFMGQHKTLLLTR